MVETGQSARRFRWASLGLVLAAAKDLAQQIVDLRPIRFADGGTQPDQRTQRVIGVGCPRQ